MGCSQPQPPSGPNPTPTPPLFLPRLRHEPYNLKVDVYSFAMIIFQLFETTVPFAGHDPVDAARQAAMLGARPGFPPRKQPNKMTEVSCLVVGERERGEGREGVGDRGREGEGEGGE